MPLSRNVLIEQWKSKMFIKKVNTKNNMQKQDKSGKSEYKTRGPPKFIKSDQNKNLHTVSNLEKIISVTYNCRQP